MVDIRIFPDLQALSIAAAEHFTSLAQQTIASRGQFNVVLSGGSTPRSLYTLLAEKDISADVDWTKVYIFLGDERCVPPNHPDSNYHMARETLLDNVPVPPANIHRMRGEIDPVQAAELYELEIKAHFDNNPMPVFDLVYLGLGDDGHTASIFPKTIAVREKHRLVVAHFIEKVSSWRITMTPVLLNAAANLVFLVVGTGKARMVQDVIYGPFRPHMTPAQVINPQNGRLTWMLDQAAANQLK